MLAGVIAYAIWGAFPLYWPLLRPAGAPEILAHRVVWSLVVMAVVLTLTRGWGALRMPARVWRLVALAAVLIGINWGVYIWAVNNGRVVDAALGYFVTPLFTVLLGVLLFGERLRVAQWVAVGLGACAVVVMAVEGHAVPWVGLSLAVSFGLYGLVKKVVPLAPAASLTAEGLVLVAPALAFLVVLQVRGGSTLSGNGAGHVLLLAGAGLLTCVPLLAFATAARALPLSTLGLLQYLTPVAQFLLGVFWAHEAMPPARWIGFAMIWSALVVLSTDGLRRMRHQDARADAEPGAR